MKISIDFPYKICINMNFFYVKSVKMQKYVCFIHVASYDIFISFTYKTHSFNVY